MELYSRFEWSNNNLTLRQFMDHYGHVLPQIVKVTEGYSGRDEDMHQIGADEIYWVHEMLAQPRVLLKDQHGRCNSVPLNDVSMFQLYKKDGHMTDNLLLQEALRQYRHKEDFIQFASNKLVVTSAGAESSRTERLGLMVKLDEYDQKYLLVHDMSSDQIMPQRSAIPLYVPITVEVALDLKFSADKTFQEFIDETAKVVSKCKISSVKLDKGILQFDKEPEGDYSYAHPLFRQVVGGADAEKDLSCLSHAVVIQQTTDDAMPKNKEVVVCDNTVKEEELSSDDYEVIDDDSLYFSIEESKMIPRPQSQVGKSEIVPQSPKNRYTKSPTSSSNVPLVKTGSPKVDTPTRPSKTAQSPRQVIAEPPKPAPAFPARQALLAEFKKTKAASASPKPKPALRGTKRREGTSSPRMHHAPSTPQLTAVSTAVERKPRTSSRAASKSMYDPCISNDGLSIAKSDVGLVESCNWRSGADIPLHINDFTVDQVHHALHLLKLDDVALLMSGQSVDGRLLVELDEDILIEDFKCKRFEARKIISFVKGWRPKD